MHLIRSFEPENAALVGWGVRVMLVTRDGRDGLVSRRLAGIGGQVESLPDLGTALSLIADDPFGYSLVVIECDAFGGVADVRRRVAMQDESALRVPVILVSRDCPVQVFPADRGAPVMLRAPLSAVSLRVGFEHALRDRLAQRAV